MYQYKVNLIQLKSCLISIAGLLHKRDKLVAINYYRHIFAPENK